MFVASYVCISWGVVQGSFERIGELGSAASVPTDYLQTAEHHAAEGCYVLALAHRLPFYLSATASGLFATMSVYTMCLELLTRSTHANSS